MYTDGSCNPDLPGRPGGWAFVCADGQSGCGFAWYATSARMELLAVVQALRALPPGGPVKVYTDARFIAGAVRNGIVRADRLAPELPDYDLWLTLQVECCRRPVSLQKVRGHCGISGNERADRLARQAWREAFRLQGGELARAAKGANACVPAARPTRVLPSWPLLDG